jgi:hypothetical protein
MGGMLQRSSRSGTSQTAVLVSMWVRHFLSDSRWASSQIAGRAYGCLNAETSGDVPGRMENAH